MISRSCRGHLGYARLAGNIIAPSLNRHPRRHRYAALRSSRACELSGATKTYDTLSSKFSHYLPLFFYAPLIISLRDAILFRVFMQNISMHLLVFYSIIGCTKCERLCKNLYVEPIARL